MNIRTSTPHVVLYGHDPTLHLTRRWLLERMGFEVSTAGTVSELKQLQQHHTTQLLVVCYTVETAECDEVIAASQSAFPGLKVALLSSLMHRNPSHSLRQSQILVDNPASFSKAIQRLIDNAEREIKPVFLN